MWFLIALLALAQAPADVDPCTFGIPLTGSGDVVVVVTLEQPPVAGLPVFGADEIKRLWVPARIDEIRKGEFPYPAGSQIGIAVHSIALTFGSDFAGEKYEVGFDGDRIVSIVPEESERFQLRGTVVGGTPTRTDKVRDLGEDDAPRVRIRVDSIDGEGLAVKTGDVIVMRLQAPKDAPICIFGLHRPSRPRQPYRTLRVVR